MSHRYNLNDLLSTALRTSMMAVEAGEATAKIHELQRNDEVEALNAWNELYDRLVQTVSNDPIARNSKLGKALIK